MTALINKNKNYDGKGRIKKLKQKKVNSTGSSSYWKPSKAFVAIAMWAKVIFTHKVIYNY